MASTETYYARPVLIRGDKDRSRVRPIIKQAQEVHGRPKSSSSSPTVPIRSRKSPVETPPPPRPPPPRPERAPKHKVLPATPEPLRNGFPETKSSSAETMASHQHQLTPEPKPLTRTNVTKHDGIWQHVQDENQNGPNDILSPPLKYITPQTMEEKLRNFDPLDVLDSASDHSDSSADTMIMMTTEEEKKNTERIKHSLKEYKTVKFKDDIPNTNKVKLNMQNAKSVLKKYKDTNGRVPIKGNHLLNGDIDVSDRHEDFSNKVKPLHIKTDHMNGTENVSNKMNGHQSSPHDDSPDDGYGTNSSSGTISSPFSSSFNSTHTDLENSGNGGVKGTILPNGAIKPNSVRENWAVKRKQRMIEAQDNSVQEQLRSLTRIEEEAALNSGNISQKRTDRNVNILQADDNVFNDTRMAKHDKNRITSSLREHRRKLPPEPISDRRGEQAFVNVSQNEIAHRNRQLYVRNSESDARKAQTLPSRLGSRQGGPLPNTSNEINVPPPIPPHQNGQSRRHFSTSAAERIYDRVYEPANSVHQQANEQMNYPGYNEERVRAEDTRFYSIASQDSVESAPLMLKTVADQQVKTPNGSGNIYVSAAGDEGCYSLNRSWSNASFLPITEVDESTLPQDPVTIGQVTKGPAPSSPQSPLEQMSGDLLEKWSDMDRNYRNYYGFDEQTEKYARTDSKINYFQEKKINNLYGHDNYYQPQGYNQTTADTSVRQQSANQGRGKDSVPNSQNSKAPVSDGQKSQHSGSKNKLFQILPNMFKPSSKKQNADKNAKNKGKVRNMPVTIEPTTPVDHKDVSLDYESEAEYVNMSDLPQYSMANIIQEESLKKGKCVSMETLQKRPVFASSKDIQKLFSLHDQSFDSISAPGGQRHSFHAMPLSYRHLNRDPGNSEDMRPRAQSTSATMRSQTMRYPITDNRMSVLYNKNQSLSQRLQVTSASSVGNLSAHSNSSSANMATSRTRLDSGSSGGDSKLSTLV